MIDIEEPPVGSACPACDGQGEWSVYQDYWSNHETKSCKRCLGTGEVQP